VDDSKVFIPFDAAKDDIKDRPASLLVDIVPFLVQTKKELVVIDQASGCFRPMENIIFMKTLPAKGYKPEDVSIVLLSHLHKDHASGICYGKEGAYNLMFPNARYYCQEQEMKAAFASKDSPSYLLDKLDFLRHTSNLVYMNGDGSIDADIKYEVSGGHTQFHQVFIVQAGEQTCFFGGDVLPQPKAAADEICGEV
jgi:glyoxylase-like metal-dependent hydrolase (beta-lactamase superfamily II)